ncbi:low molecular weight phosphatase family protein [Salinibacterium sp. ZJ454]|uniref:arsenate reductase/protein-tyrosine-phosphatase family protein n=1 Tax=Salinibacterium sp. ZJ454 TaxID=2708339 RepID=UPI001FB8A682|nr:low molecular weight phosphatase family protein [Salinibacterium sp. ZJ454]
MTGVGSPEPAQFSILTVCTGNVCRSPLAEQLLRAGLQDWPQVAVASAGLGALVDRPMPEPALAMSASLGGIGGPEHRARQLDERLVRNADLVFAMAREHRRGTVELLPRASRVTFTVREFARLAEGLTADDLTDVATLPLDDVAGRFAELVRVVASRRGLVEQARHPEDDDVIDPYRQSDEVYQRSADELVPAVGVVLRTLRLAATVTVA